MIWMGANPLQGPLEGGGALKIGGPGMATSETHVHKITNVQYFFIWRLDLLLLMGANPLLGPSEVVVPENLDFIRPKRQLLRLLPFQGPPLPNANGRCDRFARIKIITSCAI
jgi:hypothetical protein